LEVFAKTGTPISQLQQQFDKGAAASQRRVFVLDWPRQELYRRIEQRVEQMFAAGLVEEVKRLLGKVPHEHALLPDESSAPRPDESPALRPDESSAFAGQCSAGRLSAAGQEFHQRVFSRTALQAVGYREVIEHLQGRRDLPSTIALVKQRSRQLAKRQMTWFRSLSECRFVPVSAQQDAERVAQAIASAGQQWQ